ncbi:MAG: urocanate hydratase [Deltaproteobacteria bacterium]|nr:urocanate hydratase [Deltaproteobacteria bacterium]
MTGKSFKESIEEGIPDYIPEHPKDDPEINHAPKRPDVLTFEEKRLALSNALRYFPKALHEKLAPEFADELEQLGRIYMHRYRPDYAMHARPMNEYPARCPAAAAIMLMIQNNLDPRVAQHPYELITYGGNGTVFQNWAQYRLTMKYLSKLTEDQTLVLYSGHPLGIFPSSKWAPRLVLTNGMMVPAYSTPQQYDRLSALGVTSYGQMTAGSFMYIGPQGIVHGTTITLLNAGRKYLGIEGEQGLRGKVFVSSGLGGMSGAQAKAAVISGAIGVIAEINPKAVAKRHDQGWVQEVETDLDKVLGRIDRARKDNIPLSLAYLGNVVDLWERMVKENMQVELGSDQTSLHIPFTGGYYPAGLSMDQALEMMRKDPAGFKEAVRESLKRQVLAINSMSARGMSFWDYGNAFLLEAGRAGADIFRENGKFKYPSYVEDIMGPLVFDLGFGPFRWVCTSNDTADLQVTDEIAADIIEEMISSAPKETLQQLKDNLHWIRHAGENKLVVGSKARILYSHEQGRIKIALAFNKAVREGRIRAPVVIGRDHHDVGGTDSPFRETANIYDGSNLCADMAVHNMVGDSFRGASWVSLHNGGGVGWGQVINGGFGLVLDGSEEADNRIRSMISWDVTNGLARRAWAGNNNAKWAISRAMEKQASIKVTMPNESDTDLLVRAVEHATAKRGN